MGSECDRNWAFYRVRDVRTSLLLDELFSLMVCEESDYIRTFRMLSHTKQQNIASPLHELHNWLAQCAIDAAEQGDISELYWLHEILRQPFTGR